MNKQTHLILTFHVVLTAILLLMPSRDNVELTDQRRDPAPSGGFSLITENWGSARLSPARQVAYALNMPVLIVAAPAAYAVIELLNIRNKLILTMLFLGVVVAFWAWLVRRLYVSFHRIYFIFHLVITAGLAYVALGLSMHYVILRFAAWTWFIVWALMTLNYARHLKQAIDRGHSGAGRFD